MATFPYTSPYDLTEFTMIAGTNQELVFSVFTSASGASGSTTLDISGGTVTWYLGRMGSGSAVVTKTGVLSGTPNYEFKVYLLSTDTASLNGKFVQQYVLTDSSGSPFRPSQGYVNISKAYS